MIHPALPLRRRALLAGAAALPAAAVLAGCRDQQQPVAEADGPPDQVSYLTNFGTFGRDAYAWMTQTAGHFDANRLEVTIEPGAGTEQNIAALLTGQAHFAAIDLAGAALAYGGADASAVGYVALAAIHQQPLATMMGRAADLRQPSDIEGGKIGLSTGAITDLLFDPWAGLAGIDPARVEKIYMVAQDLIGSLATGEVDAIGQFVPGLATAERVVGEEIAMYPYSDHIDDVYGVGLFTTAELAAADPDLCIRFRDALLAGLADALDDPAAAGEALHAAVPETDPAGAAAELELMAPYCRTPGVALGDLDEVRMSQHMALLESLGLTSLRAHQSAEIVAWDLTLRPQ